MCFEDGVWTFPFWAELSLILFLASFIVSKDQVSWPETFIPDSLVVIGLHSLFVLGFLNCGLVSCFF
ncbi:hypothetical protein Hanom_Chr12g01144801 [Helianthus anomalus]